MRGHQSITGHYGYTKSYTRSKPRAIYLSPSTYWHVFGRWEEIQTDTGEQDETGDPDAKQSGSNMQNSISVSIKQARYYPHWKTPDA